MRRPRPERQTSIRCAIYTRKSTQVDADQEFNTLDAQREQAEAYIKDRRIGSVSPSITTMEVFRAGMSSAPP